MTATIDLSKLHEIRDNYLASLERDLPHGDRERVTGITVGLGLAIALTEGGDE